MSTYPDLSSKVTLASLARKKRQGEKISMQTAYDYPLALLADRSGMDTIMQQYQ